MSEFFPPVNQPGLFASAVWKDAWIKSWGNCSAIKQIDSRSEIHNLLPEAPCLYSYNFSPLPLIKFKTLFTAGTSTPIAQSIRSEYFIPPGGSMRSLINTAMKYSWSQLWIPDLINNSVECVQLYDEAKKSGLKLFVRDMAVSYAVNLQREGFSGYLKSLGSNTRLKLFNKRKRLYEAGEIRIKNIWPDIDGFIEILNQFHQLRWGKLCYQGRNRELIVACMNNVVADGGEVDLSVIYCNGAAISAVLDIHYQQRIYNIQSGFVENFGNGVSLGTLHFGFQIEKAFETSATFYDFMAGNGKNNNYKAALATQTENFISIMLVRSKILAALYVVNDRIKSLRNKRAVPAVDC